MRRSITEYGAVPGTGAKCTEQIQRAIDECAKEGGGTVVTCGTPEEVAGVPESYTGQFLKRCLAAGKQ